MNSLSIIINSLKSIRFIIDEDISKMTLIDFNDEFIIDEFIDEEIDFLRKIDFVISIPVVSINKLIMN